MTMSDLLKKRLLAKCEQWGIAMMGVAPVEAWDDPPFDPWVPLEFRPRAIYPEAKSVIVIGLPVTLPVVETAPSIHYNVLYHTVNAALDQATYALSNFLNAQGHASMFVPRDGYGHISLLRERALVFFSHRHAAYLAGLGTFGLNNMLLTEEYGPRVRFGSVFTTALIDPDRPRGEGLCTRCGRCVDICPVRALSGEDYPQGLTNKEACATRALKLSEKFTSPCGFCIKVCPIGEDRKLFGREDLSIYDEGDAKFEEHHKAWKHVRSYGSRK
jgi:epoxyqueuosine reductase